MVGIVASPADGVHRDTPTSIPVPERAWRMSAATRHTLLEQLLFSLSICTLGSDPSIFTRISSSLREDEFVRADPNFDAERLSPTNLQELYLRLLKDEVRSTAQAAASPPRGSESNPRKRKLSTPPLQSLEEAAEHNHLLPRLVDRLHARYQEDAVKVIHKYDDEYQFLKKEVDKLELSQREEAFTKRTAVNGVDDAPTEKLHDRADETPLKSDIEVETSPKAHQVSRALDQRATPSRNILESRDTRSSMPPSTTALGPQVLSSTDNKVPSPSLPPSELPAAVKRGASASPHRPPSKAAETLARSANHTPNLQQSQSAAASPHHYATPQAKNLTQPLSQQYQWNQPFPAYAAHGPQATMPTYPSSTPKEQPVQYAQIAQQMYQGSQSSQAPPYVGFSSPHPGYMVYQSQASGFSTPHLATTQSPVSGPSRRNNIPLINTNVSTTKWKSTGPAQKSPVAPPHSPFLPSSPDSPTRRVSKTPIPPNRKPNDAPETGNPTRSSGRRGRWAGHTTRGRGIRADATRSAKESRTRSQSIASYAEESAAELPQTKRLRGGELGTPNPATEDTSAISTPASTSRPGHRRSMIRGSVDVGRPILKRKRTNTIDGSPEVTLNPRQLSRPNHVLATKNFHRIVQPLMQEINSHKLASMFAKPITERDAPGYQSIIYQPQDLKTIRAAISAGTRAIQAAEKESTEAGEDVSSPVGIPGSGGGSKPPASIWLEKSPEIMPPKAIVNAAQMEKESYRMFANAVMFNLDPHRGFGAAERRPKGLDDAEDGDGEDAEKHYEVDDGGAFVRDAREMFESVEESVARWRSVEGGGTKPRTGDDSEADELANEVLTAM